MSDRIHQVTSAILRDEDPENLILAIREALRAERDDGHREGYSDCLRDRWEARRIAEHRGELDMFAPPLDAEGRHPEGDYDLWHLATYIPAGREREFAKLLSDDGIEVYRMWPVESLEQVKAAMDECEASLRTPGMPASMPGRKDGTDGG